MSPDAQDEIKPPGPEELSDRDSAELREITRRSRERAREIREAQAHRAKAIDFLILAAETALRLTVLKTDDAEAIAFAALERVVREQL